jgi:uncharacterized membrane protein
VTIGGVKGVVVAVGATASSFGSIPVGTIETGIDTYFLYPFSKKIPEVGCIGIVTPVMSPGIIHALKVLKQKKGQTVNPSLCT